MKPIRSGAKLTVTIKQAAYSGQRDKAACLFFIIQNCYYEQGHSQNDHEFFICTSNKSNISSVKDVFFIRLEYKRYYHFNIRLMI